MSDSSTTTTTTSDAIPGMVNGDNVSLSLPITEEYENDDSIMSIDGGGGDGRHADDINTPSLLKGIGYFVRSHIAVCMWMVLYFLLIPFGPGPTNNQQKWSSYVLSEHIGFVFVIALGNVGLFGASQSRLYYATGRSYFPPLWMITTIALSVLVTFLLFNCLFLTFYHPFRFWVMLNVFIYITLTAVVGRALFRSRDPNGYSVAFKTNIMVHLSFVLCILFLIVFYATDSNVMHSIYLVMFSISQFIWRECVRWMISPDSPVISRLGTPYNVNLLLEFFLTCVFPQVDSVYVFTLVFLIQASTNLFQPVLMRNDFWCFKQKVKAKLGIAGQYPNQLYKDYIPRAGVAYLLTLLAQLSSHP